MDGLLPGHQVTRKLSLYKKHKTPLAVDDLAALRSMKTLKSSALPSKASLRQQFKQGQHTADYRFDRLDRFDRGDRDLAPGHMDRFADTLADRRQSNFDKTVRECSLHNIYEAEPEPRQAGRSRLGRLKTAFPRRMKSQRSLVSLSDLPLAIREDSFADERDLPPPLPTGLVASPSVADLLPDYLADLTPPPSPLPTPVLSSSMSTSSLVSSSPCSSVPDDEPFHSSLVKINSEGTAPLSTSSGDEYLDYWFASAAERMAYH
ncbi:uncharacterized protein V1510DRAFT_415891 [Dipodascopsis tothii]|uniref:uncharacterized protein n=1 Tax=Dipodascopsis tothii TaxID=44089 RepID=UPI0034CE087F